MDIPTGKCEVCKTPVNTSFADGLRIYYYCEAHKDELYEKVTGKKPKPSKRR
jgi:hypothetical protein